jgi:1-deoxy-D-xylulose-5-phosphate synthase
MTSVLLGLGALESPADLRSLPPSSLPGLASQIRERLIEAVSRTGGHLGPNLGVVELTIALHRVFDSPRDSIVWDTGHQSYVHKMLTGRSGDLDSLRQAGGLSGYPRRAESPHDLVENSHASTSLSYADGLAKAYALQGLSERAVVAVVGDGAMTGGMCWEALNNIGAAPDRPVIVVLNDNGRSYSPTVGSARAALAEVFDSLGLAYIGPVDGHDIGEVEAALADARALGRAVVVHCRTVKGKGYPAAENEKYDRMHAISSPSLPGRPTWTSVFGSSLSALAASRPDLVAITAAMLHPTGLGEFASTYPDRVFDVGIAEQHAVTSAAGLAMGGMHPVVCLYATFLNRAFDQMLMDVALHRLPVTFVLDRAGVTGSDGPSHNGMWDLSLLGIVPGMRVAVPRDGESLRRFLERAVRAALPEGRRECAGAGDRSHRGGGRAFRFALGRGADVGDRAAGRGRRRGGAGVVAGRDRGAGGRSALGAAGVFRSGIGGARPSADRHDRGRGSVGRLRSFGGAGLPGEPGRGARVAAGVPGARLAGCAAVVGGARPGRHRGGGAARFLIG